MVEHRYLNIVLHLHTCAVTYAQPFTLLHTCVHMHTNKQILNPEVALLLLGPLYAGLALKNNPQLATLLSLLIGVIPLHFTEHTHCAKPFAEAMMKNSTR